MRRVLVIGCGGAGKSTFARELAARVGLPLVHLDQLYWRPGWTPTPLPEWEALVREAVAGERWVIDGNYGGTLALRLEAADTAVFLDVPRRTCLRRVVVRGVRGRGRPRADLAPGCPEKLPDLEFLRWIWSYPRHVRPRMLAQLEEFERRGGQAFVLRSTADARGFVDALRPASAGEAGVVSIAGTVSEERKSDGL
jgi:adenylate kinase family enzyme